MHRSQWLDESARLFSRLFGRLLGRLSLSLYFKRGLPLPLSDSQVL